MRYSLRTLLIVMLLGGPLCAAGWWFREEAWEMLRYGQIWPIFLTVFAVVFTVLSIREAGLLRK